MYHNCGRYLLAASTVFVGVLALLLSIYPRKDSDHISLRVSLEESYLSKLQEHGIHIESGQVIQNSSSVPLDNVSPDTTAIILNWSRLDNVKLIASLLCGPWLSDIILQVVIWSNNPKMYLTLKVSINK